MFCDPARRKATKVHAKTARQLCQKRARSANNVPFGHHPGDLIPTAAAIDSLRQPRVSAIALIAGGASEASLEGCQHAGIREHPSRPAQERGHLRMTVTGWCRWYHESDLAVSSYLTAVAPKLRPVALSRYRLFESVSFSSEQSIRGG
jgi:hypothetical protein